MLSKGYYPTRQELFETIVNEFEGAYSWLGKQVAEEFLYSVASWNINHFTVTKGRTRQHILLHWKHGWLKSALLLECEKLLGNRLSTVMGDISNAALRGTVDKGVFIPPIVLEYPFIFILELGRITKASDTDLVQTFLSVLEEGIGKVDLAKVNTLKDEERQIVTDQYSIEFTSRSGFRYTTDSVFQCATYSNKFIEDMALQSRYNVVIPNRPLTGELTRYVQQHGAIELNENTLQLLRSFTTKKPPMKFGYELPNEIYIHDPSPRDASKLKSWAWSRLWWGLEVDDVFINERFRQDVKRQLESRLTSEDKFVALLEMGHYTIQEICDELNCSKSWVYSLINRLKVKRKKDLKANKIVFTIPKD